LRTPGTAGTVLGVNLGKQRETPLDRAGEDYHLLLERFAPLADYVAINVSSPNTPDLRALQDRRWLEPLLVGLVRRRDELAQPLARRVPLLVKISPDLTEAELERSLGAILGAGADGIIATNTTLSRTGLSSARAIEAGGLSGAALSRTSTAVIRRVHATTGGRLPIVASGGVMSVEEAQAKLDAGASLVQVYTGLIYEGPGLVPRLLRELRGADRRG
jgi:dihydroorotate dehydrogenase